MQQINAPKPPAWRDPARLRAEARRRRLRPALFLLSLVVGLLLAVPPGGRYDEAISLQLAGGAPTAWALFVAMAVTLGYVAVRLWNWENRVGAVASGIVVLGLGAIALTDPYSSDHLTVFAGLSGAIFLGHLGFFYGHLDLRLLPTTVLTAGAIVLCLSHIGLGERLLIASSLATLNLLVYGHLDL